MAEDSASPYKLPPYESHRLLAEEESGSPYTPPPYGSYRWLAEGDTASPYTPPPHDSHRWLAEDSASAYTPPPYGSHRWLAESDSPYTPFPYGSHRWLAKDNIAAVPYSLTQILMPERAGERKTKVGAPLSTYHAKAEAVTSLEIRSVNNTGRRYLRQGYTERVRLTGMVGRNRLSALDGGIKEEETHLKAMIAS